MRREDWHERLWPALEAVRERPFEYGHCVRLAAECVDAMCDSVIVERVMPLIEAQKEPIALDDLQNLATMVLGSEPVPVNHVCQGDVCLLELPSGAALGICTGTMVAVAAKPKGVAYLKLNKIKLGWRIA